MNARNQVARRPTRVHGAHSFIRSYRTPSLEPTPEELEAGASLPRDPAPEPVECRATDAPPSPAVLTLNGLSASFGPSVGVDAHFFEGTTLSLDDLTQAVKQVTSLPGPRRFGP